MHKALVWTLAVYVALKFAGMVLAKDPGFRNVDLSVLQRLRAGEPFLLLTAVGTAVPLALLTNWYSHRHFEQMFDDATTCFAQITTLRARPEMTRGVSSYAVYETVNGYKSLSFDAAAQLGMLPVDAERAMAAKVLFTSHLSASPADPGSTSAIRQQVAAGRRCLLPRPPGPNA